MALSFDHPFHKSLVGQKSFSMREGCSYHWNQFVYQYVLPQSNSLCAERGALKLWILASLQSNSYYNIVAKCHSSMLDNIVGSLILCQESASQAIPVSQLLPYVLSSICFAFCSLLSQLLPYVLSSICFVFCSLLSQLLPYVLSSIFFVFCSLLSQLLPYVLSSICFVFCSLLSQLLPYVLSSIFLSFAASLELDQ